MIKLTPDENNFFYLMATLDAHDRELLKIQLRTANALEKIATVLERLIDANSDS